MKYFVAAVLACLSGMAHAELIGTPVAIESGDTYTAETGSDRYLVISGFAGKDTGTPTWSATFGGVSMTLAANGGYHGNYIWLCFVLVDADIPTGAQTLTVTAAGGTVLVPFYGEARTLGGRDQSTAIEASFTTSGGSVASETSLTTASVTNSEGADLLAVIGLSPGDTVSVRPTGWTHRTANGTSLRASIEDRTNAPATTGTLTWEFPGNFYVYGLVSFAAADAAASAMLLLRRRR